MPKVFFHACLDNKLLKFHLFLCTLLAVSLDKIVFSLFDFTSKNKYDKRKRGMQAMKKVVSREWFSTRDKIGGTLKTELCSHDDHTYTAISFYWQDEAGDCYGVATGTDPQNIVKKSRKKLRKEWKEELKYRTENPAPAWYGKLIMANGDISYHKAKV